MLSCTIYLSACYDQEYTGNIPCLALFEIEAKKKNL